MKKGKFIVIDGVDGSGKATQTALLAENLSKQGVKVKTVHFPRYTETLFGALIGECLTGAHGDFLKVDPYIASVVYAAERYESAPLIRSWIKKGYTVIADRYASSNQIHQGSKIRDPKERKQFLAWLDKMEFETFRIPRPDLIIYLDMPVALAKKLLSQKGAHTKKTYLRGKKDIVEGNKKYMEESRKSAVNLARENNHWVTVPCALRGKMRSREDIQKAVLESIKHV